MKQSIYNKRFYEKSIRVDRMPSYITIAEYLNNTYGPKSVIDYGCGCGWILYYLKKAGVERICGIEPSLAAMEVQTDSMIKEAVFQKYLHVPLEMPSIYFDMALCVEVAEHINEVFSNVFISNITSRTNFLVFSVATPGQGGVGHVNEHPWNYWFKNFQVVGFVEREKETVAIQQHLKKNRAKSWYSNNIRILRRK